MYYVSPSLFVIDFVNIRGFSGDIANGRAGRNPAISMKIVVRLINLLGQSVNLDMKPGPTYELFTKLKIIK